jgi:hypothetical protein
VAGWHALGSGLDQQAKHVEAVVLRQRGEADDGIGFFQISTIAEMTTWVKQYFNGC